MKEWRHELCAFVSSKTRTPTLKTDLLVFEQFGSIRSTAKLQFSVAMKNSEWFGVDMDSSTLHSLFI